MLSFSLGAPGDGFEGFLQLQDEQTLRRASEARGRMQQLGRTNWDFSEQKFVLFKPKANGNSMEMEFFYGYQGGIQSYDMENR